MTIKPKVLGYAHGSPDADVTAVLKTPLFAVSQLNQDAAVGAETYVQNGKRLVVFYEIAYEGEPT